MTIDKRALFESTKALWPRTIMLSDPDATNEIYWANEKAVPAEDSWRQIAVWSYHQAISEIEEVAGAKGHLTIRPHEIRFDAFDRWMRSNLNGHDDWRDERAEWEAST